VAQTADDALRVFFISTINGQSAVFDNPAAERGGNLIFRI